MYVTLCRKRHMARRLDAHTIRYADNDRSKPTSENDAYRFLFVLGVKGRVKLSAAA